IVTSLQTDIMYHKLYKSIIESSPYAESVPRFDISGKRTIDQSHHYIRYSSMVIQFYIFTIHKEQSRKDPTIKRQIIALFHSVNNACINECTTWKEYNQKLKDNELCILKLSKNGEEYQNHYSAIYKT